MHPIEQLRYVARAQGADPTSLAVETASALEHLAVDPSGLVVACRRVVERHPTVGPLWWTCAHLLTAADPRRRARELIGELYGDPTEDHLVASLPAEATVAITGMPPVIGDALCRRGDLKVVVIGDDRYSATAVHRLERAAEVEHVAAPFAEAAWHMRSVDLALVEADAVGGGRAVVELGGGVLAAVAAAARRALWLVAARGRRLPDAYIDVMCASLDADGGPPSDVIAVDAAATLVTPDGALAGDAGSRSAPECPYAAELVRTVRKEASR